MTPEPTEMGYGNGRIDFNLLLSTYRVIRCLHPKFCRSSWVTLLSGLVVVLVGFCVISGLSPHLKNWLT